MAFFISLIIIISYASVYSVGIGEQAIITQFGKIVEQSVTKPGLHFKIPLLQKTHYLPNHVVYELSIGPSSNEVSEYETVLIEQLAKWKIGDPVRYFINFGDYIEIKEPIVQALSASLTETIERHKLSDLVEHLPNGEAKFVIMKNDETNKIMKRANNLLNPKGIEIIGLYIKFKL